jgi:hypothetical protein
VASTITRALIEGATWESIQAQPYDGTRYSCGCHPHPKEPHQRFYLCDYHDGFDSGVDQGCHKLQTENERLRAALVAIQSEAGVFDDGGCACSDVYVRTLDRIWKMAVYALPVVGGPS